MRLENKVAIITGGSRGLGYAMATRFAEEGATVYVADINEVHIDNERIHFIYMNVADHDSVAKAVNKLAMNKVILISWLIMLALSKMRSLIR